MWHLAPVFPCMRGETGAFFVVVYCISKLYSSSLIPSDTSVKSQISKKFPRPWLTFTPLKFGISERIFSFDQNQGGYQHGKQRVYESRRGSGNARCIPFRILSHYQKAQRRSQGKRFHCSQRTSKQKVPRRNDLRLPFRTHT